MKRVVVGLSGGVDSSVTAHLLIEQGYEVIGMFMKNWHDESVTLSDECPWIDDSNDALLIANQLGIPFQVIDLSKEYKTRIVDYMFDEYESGRTPNPDVLCNREIKFDVFLKAAEELGADFVATGHYCQKIKHEDGSYGLLAGKDGNKDQSYFLCQLSQAQLSKALFPIGHLEKPQVREIALAQDLVTANKKDSQGLCFVGKISLPNFLQQKLKVKKGNVLEVSQEHFKKQVHYSIPSTFENVIALAQPYTFENAETLAVAEHQGAHFYTIGQRKGLHIGGRPLPSFVLATDTENNIVYSGQDAEHPLLNRHALFINSNEIHWINEKFALGIDDELEVLCRVRYRQKLQKARILRKAKGMYVYFYEKQRGITPGQFCAWYLKEELIGSGVIQH
jgi:tRNA-specific 2-thiouridylase